MSLQDNEIIQNIRNGAKQQFAVLVDRYKDRAMTLAVRMLRNREDARDALQDAFVRAYRGLERFEGASQFSTWLYRILYNTCLTRLSKRKRERQIVDVDEGEEMHVEEIHEADPHSLLETKDMVVLVRKIMNEMPERYSSILSLFYSQEMSYEEIGEITRLPLGTVKAHLFRARAMLQKRLANVLRGEFAPVAERS